VTQVAIPAGPSPVEGYRAVAGDAAMKTLESLARKLTGHRIAMVSAASTGGGGAEILHRMVPLLNELGVATTWEVMRGDARFSSITKKIHHTLHGWPGTLEPDDREHFHDVSRRAARELELDADLILVHDPQPVALAGLRRSAGQRWVWRCHVDLSRALPDAWDFIEPNVARFDAAVFSHVAFVPPLPLPTYLVPPSIDPLSDKNREMSETEQEGLLRPFGLPANRPWVTQISRFDRIKDPAGVIEAFQLVRSSADAQLLLAGPAADDDPEAAEVLAEVRARAGDSANISILPLPPDAHRVINALQRRSRVCVQKSLREGFALTVTEALWKRRAVVASAVGGIPLQVHHERTGLLVRSIEGCAFQITRLLRSPELRKRLGQAGREHVLENFLHPREARDYLAIFARLLASAQR
jgi:trehalose synthase